jgi:hypothetical protein
MQQNKWHNKNNSEKKLYKDIRIQLYPASESKVWE